MTQPSTATHHQVLIIGAGTAGLTVAAQLCDLPDAPEVAIIDPSETHYYQPLWTLVGGGVFEKEITARPTEDYIPLGATWIRDAVASFEPEENSVTTASGARYSYDALVVAPGIQLNWGKIKGLINADGSSNVGRDGICSNYSFQTVDSTWDNIRSFSGGDAVFTFPVGPIKCAGAPQKIMWLAEHWFEKQGIRERCNVTYASATAGMFGVKKYGDALTKLANKRNIIRHFRNELIEVKPASREAIFRHCDTGEEQTLHYDMLHITPPQSAPDFVRQSPLANADGWVDVDMYTCQHTRYPNVFSLGDASSLPCSKTGAAVRKEAPVVSANVHAFLLKQALPKRYDGYASCPLVTGYGRLILAEFTYGGVVAETFPFNQAQERYSMYAMKAYGLPAMYWHGMLRGRV